MNVSKKQEEEIEMDEEYGIVGVANVEDEEFQLLTKRPIDLEKLQFIKGSHFMSNEKVKLPPDSYRLTKEGYEEIFVPALK